MTSGKTIIYIVMSAVGVSLIPAAALAVPVVPNFTQGDVIPTSAPTVGAAAAFGNITSTAAGAAGDLAGTIATSGAITLTAGGAGTNATGQFVSELSILH